MTRTQLSLALFLLVAFLARPVSGESPSVVFVLDCSGSMAKSVDTGLGRSTAIEQATAALSDVIENLADADGDSKPRVGAYFFGHRLTWTADEPYSVENNLKSVDDNVPEGLFPANDVERVVSLRNLTAKSGRRLLERLDAVEAHGLSPVNLAIVDALGEFGDADKDHAKCVIVITDGSNDQRHPTWAQGFDPKADITTTEKAIEKWDATNATLEENQQIVVHVIGYNLGTGDQKADQSELKKLAEHTGGKLVTADSKRELSSQIVDLLKLKQAAVQ